MPASFAGSFEYEIEEEKLSENHAGELRTESAETKGERTIAEEHQRLGWTEPDLTLRLKGDPARMAIASRPRLRNWARQRASTASEPSAKVKQTDAHKPDNVALL